MISAVSVVAIASLGGNSSPPSLSTVPSLLSASHSHRMLAFAVCFMALTSNWFISPAVWFANHNHNHNNVQKATEVATKQFDSFAFSFVFSV